MINLGYIIPLICFWNTITNEISKYKQELISSNIVSLIHCLLFMAHHNYDYNLDYAIHMSIGYYTYDLIYIFTCIYKVKSKDEFKRRFPFIIHHLFGIYLLKLSLIGKSKEQILYGYNILETSNVMLYVSYHLHKEYGNYLHLNIMSEFFQLLWYSYYRVIKFLLYIHDNKAQYFQFHSTTQFVIVALYFMGVIWSYKLVKKNIKNFNTLKEMYGYGGCCGGCATTLIDSKCN
jgi:hypothetical protein